MDEKEKAIIALLEERNMLLYDVLSLTEPVKFHKDDTLKYVELMEARQEKFDKIEGILKELENLGFDYNQREIQGSLEFKRSTEDLYNAGRATVYRIRELDLSNKPMIEEIRDVFMEQVKTVKERKNVKNLYSDDNMPSGGRLFNKTK
ncbi:MAG: hypothetical protein FWE24_06565 [Defluviitaleaceae bacterium]|nr:hypothetical protein [Defluviitaleaceae bacterium]